MTFSDSKPRNMLHSKPHPMPHWRRLGLIASTYWGDPLFEMMICMMIVVYQHK